MHTAGFHKEARRHAGCRALPLSMAGQGKKAQVRSLRGNEEQKRFLQSLGFAPGTQVSIVSELSGDLIVDVKGARVALGRQVAHKIMVE